VQKRSPKVALVGRPNVGKSTLFNRITGARHAIVTPIPGTTRDSIVEPVVWQGVTFSLVDTGGMVGASDDPLQELVLQVGRRAVAQADVVVFVVDGREGKTPADDEIAAALRAADVPVVLAINKTDDKRARAGALEFYQLGFDPAVEISAEHGLGVGDLLDLVVERLPGAPAAVRSASAPGYDDGPPATSEWPDESAEAATQLQGDVRGEVSVAIVGRPNVGKSSLVNRLLREERVLVSELPGTTRDAIETVFRWQRRQFRIVDTAGIRRAGRIAGGGQVETVSVLLSRRAIERADIAVILVDAMEGVTDQDAAIAGEADKAGRGVILAANKWDLVKDRGPDFVTTFDETARRQLKFLDYAPLLHISALTGERTPKLLEMIDRVAEARKKRIPTGALNRFVERVAAAHPPASPGRREVRILYATQVGAAPPTFVFFTNVATRFHFSYERFLVNQLREEFGFAGTPIRIQVRSRKAKARRRQAAGGKGR
jgi:GTPase